MRWTIAAILIAVSLLAVPVLADESVPSTIPHVFYGEIHDADGSGARVGSIVVASVAGIPAGTTTVTPAGEYGAGPQDGEAVKFAVGSGISPGDAIVFIDGVRAESRPPTRAVVSRNWCSRERGPPEGRPEESTTRPVNTTAGAPVTVDAGNASVVLTTTGDHQGETLIFTLFTEPPGDQPIPPGNRGIGRFAEITSTITNDNIQRVRVTLYYTDADVVGIDEASIRVYWWSPANSTWVALPGGVDTDANFAWGETDHFSKFALLGVVPKPAPASGGGGGGASVMPTSDVTPTPDVTGTETSAPAETTTPAGTGVPATTVGQETAQGEPDAATAGDLPVALIATVLGGIVIIAAGYLLLQRR